MKTKKLIVILLTFILSFPVYANDVPSSGEMIMDMILARPLGIVATAVGTGVFILATPFTLLSGTWKQSGRRLVIYPAKYTFVRGLGEFSGQLEEPLDEMKE